MNRSYQENASEYGSVKGFFQTNFEEAEICVLASHTHDPSFSNLRDMIRELRTRGYNVAAVFFSNGYNKDAERISRVLTGTNDYGLKTRMSEWKRKFKLSYHV
jgi:hypothetical protein